MKGITRRSFLSGAAGLGLAGAALGQDGPHGEVTRVPMQVEATQGCRPFPSAIDDPGHGE